MYSSRVHRMIEEWTICMRLLSWRRHQGTMLKIDIIMNVYLLLPLRDLNWNKIYCIVLYVINRNFDFVPVNLINNLPRINVR
jgi:hypothetical protein